MKVVRAGGIIAFLILFSFFETCLYFEGAEAHFVAFFYAVFTCLIFGGAVIYALNQ